VELINHKYFSKVAEEGGKRVGKQLSYLIIGNGITGVTAAETLRAADAACSITIVADEFFPVYYRPALKDYLAGRLTEERLWARPSTFYQQQRVRFVPGHVVRIQAEQQYVQLHDGQRINYDKLLLAHGARARRLLCPGQDLAGVMTLRNVPDYQQLLLRLTDAKRIVVCGSGTLALESAEALRHLGYEVIHLLRYNTIWPEVLDATASDLVLQEERRDGIDVHTEEEIAELVGTDGQVREVITTRGTHIPCDMVLIAIGIEPHIDFVRASGIACGRGIQVDAAMRTNVPHIYAAGDVVETKDAITGRTRVVGQWYPAIQQAQIAAQGMLEREPVRREKSARDTLYNATFLYGLDFVSLGQTTAPQQSGCYELIAEPQPRTYRKVVFQQGIPMGIIFLGKTEHAFAYKRAIDHRVNLNSIINYLFTDDFDLADWLDGRHVPPATIDETDATRDQVKEMPVAGGGHRSDMRVLSDKRVRFEIDMCIGCDRCMAACPIPLSAQVSISDLNQATISPEVAPHVARFTDECILCGSCVPVCPVDNHRDLLMVSLKQRFGSSWESPVDETRLQQALPQGVSVPLLVKLLRTQRILQDPQLVPTAYLLHLARASQFLQIGPGTTVLRQGEYGRNLYMILDGTLVLSASDVNEKEIPLAILSAGELIGEYGMLTGQPYNTTARAQTPVLVLQIPEQVMQRLMELVPAIKNFFTGLNADHFLASILKRMVLFQGVADDMLQYLISQAQIKLYDRNARLFSEDEQERPARETVHILLEGIVKVARQKSIPNTYEVSERIIAYRQSGDYFAGGLDLLGDSRAVTATAINRTHVAEIPYLAIQFLFQRYPEVEQRFRMRLQEYMASNLSMQTGAIPAITISSAAAVDAMLKANFHALVDDGVVEGTEVLVIDLDTCIHCSECEEACARRHGRSRMNRKGVVLNNLTVVTACRQCQDPVCMLCSRAGIARLPNGEVYITDSCIGCGICAERCPYDAISIVDIENEVESEALSGWQRFSEIFHKGIVTERQRRKLPVLNGQAASSGKGSVTPGPLERPLQYAGYEEMRKKVAIKCDLCAGYNDQACVQACPVGAAFRVRPSVFFGTTEEILKR
jgi:NADPH-dependent 2,4-dienoyl-CoA reductase/sulfur reductase-like enzyme/Fe-S-cluster-containing hydrogenase component 2/CRP-like cAMP-binding protein